MAKRIAPGQHIRCPHCAKEVVLVEAHVSTIDGGTALGMRDSFAVGKGEACIGLAFAGCPGCKRSIVQATLGDRIFFVMPRVPLRRGIHETTPENIRNDYEEATLVLNDSPKASAALSRRCLQSLLVIQGAKKSDLVDQLAEILPTLPGYVSPYIDHIRKLGNISAHAKQSKATGEIVEVDPGEAEWMLELLEELFDHYYTKPAEATARQAALNAKFADAGKLKSP